MDCKVREGEKESEKVRDTLKHGAGPGQCYVPCLFRRLREEEGGGNEEKKMRKNRNPLFMQTPEKHM